MGAGVYTAPREQLFCDASRDAERRGQAARKMSSAPQIGILSVSERGSVIGVPGARGVGKSPLTVVAGTGVSVFDQDCQRRSCSDFSVKSRDEYGLVGLAPAR